MSTYSQIGDSSGTSAPNESPRVAADAPVTTGTPRSFGASVACSGARGGYVASVMGDNNYERYLARHAVAHPCAMPMTKREYWRERTDAQDRKPGSRCC